MSIVDLDQLIAALQHHSRFNEVSATSGLKTHLEAMGLESLSIRWVSDLDQAIVDPQISSSGQYWVSRGSRWRAHWRSAWKQAIRQLNAEQNTPSLSIRREHNGLTGAWMYQAMRQRREVSSSSCEPVDIMWARSVVSYVPEERAAWRSAIIAAIATGGDESVWQPLLNAFEEGLWAFFVLPDSVVAVPRPKIHFNPLGIPQDFELGPNRSTGDAIQWASGVSFNSMKGMLFDSHDNHQNRSLYEGIYW